MRKSPAAVERDRLLALDEVKKEIEARREIEALSQEARAEPRLVWLEQEVEKLRGESARREAQLAREEERVAALEVGAETLRQELARRRAGD